MTNQVSRLFAKYSISIENILYITRKNQRTYIQMVGGECHETSAPVKTVAEKLPSDEFWSIQKGVLVSKKYIVNIDDKYNYTMIDGKVFEGRHRTPGEHQRRRKELLEKSSAELSGEIPISHESNDALPLSIQEKCAVLEDAPIAFCVIEMIFDEGGRGIAFIFRYCNKEMEALEGVPVEEMINRSFYEVFPDGDKKWIIPYADVAINGSKHILHEYSPEVNKQLTIRCFQPEPGYCACFLTED